MRFGRTVRALKSTLVPVVGAALLGCSAKAHTPLPGLSHGGPYLMVDSAPIAGDVFGPEPPGPADRIEGAAAALGLAHLSRAELAQLSSSLDELATRLESYINPLGFDLGETDVLDEVEAMVARFGPAFTSLRWLLLEGTSAWHMRDAHVRSRRLKVRLVSSCSVPHGRTETCVPLAGPVTDTTSAIDHDAAERARFVAWPIANAVRMTGPLPGLTTALTPAAPRTAPASPQAKTTEATPQASTEDPTENPTDGAPSEQPQAAPPAKASTIAAAINADLVAQAKTLHGGEALEAISAASRRIVRLLRKGNLPEVALFRGWAALDGSRLMLPPLALGQDETLVLPRLSALGRLKDFRREVGLLKKSPKTM